MSEAEVVLDWLAGGRGINRRRNPAASESGEWALPAPEALCEDDPTAVVVAWESLLNEAEDLIGQGFIPRLPASTLEQLRRDRPVYEQGGRPGLFNAHEQRLIVVLTSARIWVQDLRQSAVGQVRDAARRRRFLSEIDWRQEHFPQWGEVNNAERLFNAIAQLVPERRVTTIRYHNVERTVTRVDGEERHRLHPEAAECYVRMRAAAGADGVTLRIGSGFRDEESEARLRASNPNPNAVAARTSPHSYGLAADLQLGARGLPLTEISTRSMTNIVTMYRSPVYKWMFVNGESFGWYPYKREPWHWEYNPPGFGARFEAEARR